jgi:hypothetical protein
MSQELALTATSSSLVLLRVHGNNKKPKLWWMRQLFAAGHRYGLDVLDTLKLEDGSGFRNFYQVDSDILRMSFENDRWQNIKREYKIFRCPHGENSKRTDALAGAMPPNTSTPEMLRSIVSVNPTPDGTQGTST